MHFCVIKACLKNFLVKQNYEVSKISLSNNIQKNSNDIDLLNKLVIKDIPSFSELNETKRKQEKYK